MSTSEDKPWLDWPVELPTAAERASMDEYKALTDPVFIAEMAKENRVRSYALLAKALEGKTQGVAAVLMVRDIEQTITTEYCAHINQLCDISFPLKYYVWIYQIVVQK